MTEFKDFIYWLADIFEWTFQILPVLGNLPNYIYAVLIFAGIIYWLNWQKKMSAEAKQNGTLE